MHQHSDRSAGYGPGRVHRCAAQHIGHPRRRHGLQRHRRLRLGDLDAQHRSSRRRRPPDHELPRRGGLLTHAHDADDGRRQPPRWARQHARDPGRQPVRQARLRGAPERERRHRRDAAAGRRVPHLHGRKMAPGAHGRDHPSRTRLRALLRPHGERRRQLGRDAVRTDVPGGALLPRRRARLASHRGLLLDGPLHRRDHLVHRFQPRRRRAVVRLPRIPGRPLPASGPEGSHRRVRRRVRPGAGSRSAAPGSTA